MESQKSSKSSNFTLDQTTVNRWCCWIGSPQPPFFLGGGGCWEHPPLFRTLLIHCWLNHLAKPSPLGMHDSPRSHLHRAWLAWPLLLPCHVNGYTRGSHARTIRLLLLVTPSHLLPLLLLLRVRSCTSCHRNCPSGHTCHPHSDGHSAWRTTHRRSRHLLTRYGHLRNAIL